MKKFLSVFTAFFIASCTSAFAQPGPGPGPIPDPWLLNLPQIYYNTGCVTVSVTVPGACNGAGSINSDSSHTTTLFINGVGTTTSIATPQITTASGALTLNPSNGNVLGPALSLSSSMNIYNATGIPAGGAAGEAYAFFSAANFGVFGGSGAPTTSAHQGSLYLRSDGVPYYNTNGTTGWGALATSASPVFTGGITVTGGITADEATFNAAVPGTGTSLSALGFAAGLSQFYSYGADASTLGGFEFVQRHSDGTGGTFFLQKSAAGAVTITGNSTVTGTLGVTSSFSATRGTLTAGVAVTGAYSANTASSTVISQASTTISRELAYGPDASTNGIFELHSLRSDATNNLTMFSNDNSGNLTIGNSGKTNAIFGNTTVTGNIAATSSSLGGATLGSHVFSATGLVQASTGFVGLTGSSDAAALFPVGWTVQGTNPVAQASALYADYSSGGRIFTTGSSPSTYSTLTFGVYHSDFSNVVNPLILSSNNALFSTAIQVTGTNALNTASSAVVDFSSGAERLIAVGANNATAGAFSINGISLDGSVNHVFLAGAASGALTSAFPWTFSSATQTTFSGSGVAIAGAGSAAVVSTILIDQASTTASRVRNFGATSGAYGTWIFGSSHGDGSSESDWMTVSATQGVAFPTVTTGTNTNTMCMSAGNVMTLQASNCTISSKRFKDDLGVPDINVGAALRSIPLAYFKYKDQLVYPKKVVQDPDLLGATHLVDDTDAPMVPYQNADNNYGRPQFGLYAEDVAAADPRLALYEQDGVTPKSYRETAMLGLLTSGWQMHDDAIATLAKSLADQAAINDNLKADNENLHKQLNDITARLEKLEAAK